MSALTNGFKILNCLSGSPKGMTFSSIVAETGIPKASVHRLLKELLALNALSLDEATRRYRGGLLLAQLGAGVISDFDLRQAVRPHLEALQHASGQVATLGIRDGNEGVYIDKIEPSGLGLRLHSEIGKRFPLHCTAMGKVLLAHSDPATIAGFCRRKLSSLTDRTITSGPQLKQELENVVQQGFALDQEEITRGLVCVAAPVRGFDGSVEAAVSCTIPTFDLNGPDHLNTLTELVLQCAAHASPGPSQRHGA